MHSRRNFAITFTPFTQHSRSLCFAKLLVLCKARHFYWMHPPPLRLFTACLWYVARNKHHHVSLNNKVIDSHTFLCTLLNAEGNWTLLCTACIQYTPGYFICISLLCTYIFAPQVHRVSALHRIKLLCMYIEGVSAFHENVLQCTPCHFVHRRCKGSYLDARSTNKQIE